MTRRFRLQHEEHIRYWHIRLDGPAVHLEWGVQGGRCSRLVKELPTEGKAKAEVRRLIRQRLGKGYVEVEVEGAADAEGPQES